MNKRIRKKKQKKIKEELLLIEKMCSQKFSLIPSGFYWINRDISGPEWNTNPEIRALEISQFLRVND